MSQISTLSIIKHKNILFGSFGLLDLIILKVEQRLKSILIILYITQHMPVNLN